MEATLHLLNAHLEAVRDQLKGDLQEELQKSLHDHTEGALPYTSHASLSSQSIDMLHEIEQLLEPGQLVLADHFLGYVNAKCLCSAVELQVPDLLHEKGPLKLVDLATASGARPDRLRQVLRILHNNGIFSYDAQSDVYANNHTSTLLLRDHWTQWHNWVDLYGNQFYDMARGIPESVRKDTTRWPAQVNYDTDDDMFTYFNKQGWVPQLHRTLGGGAKAQAPGIVQDYPWEEVSHETVLDIGGGGGGLIALLLRANPNMRGAIYDLPHVIEHATSLFHAEHAQYADIADRVPKENLIGGDFFVSIPKYKVYTMKWTLHDWKEAEALKILQNIRQSIIDGPNSRLVVLESILADGRSARLSRYADMNMLMAANGLERTLNDWEGLAAKSGWRIERVQSLRNAWPCAIELRPAAVDARKVEIEKPRFESAATEVLVNGQWGLTSDIAMVERAL